jgi:hypothetical protein
MRRLGTAQIVGLIGVVVVMRLLYISRVVETPRPARSIPSQGELI